MSIDKDRVGVDAVARDVRDIVAVVDQADAPADGPNDIKQDIVLDVLRFRPELLVQVP